MFHLAKDSQNPRFRMVNTSVRPMVTIIINHRSIAKPGQEDVAWQQNAVQAIVRGKSTRRDLQLLNCH